MNTPVLTIIIPTMDNLQQLGWCVQSLLLYTEFPFNITIIDNGCKGEVKDFVSHIDIANIKVIEPSQNLGWMESINTGVKDCNTEYICMLNDDVVFIPGKPQFWRVLINHFHDPSVGAVGPSSNFVAGTQSLLCMDTPPFFNTSMLIGFCMIMRTNLFKHIGGLDSELPGGDDLDLSIRLLNEHKLLRVDRTVYIHHFGQQTGKRLFGESWDSNTSQEETNNALIKKHGVKAWYECHAAHWGEIVDVQELGLEEDWYREVLSDLAHMEGINIGCGNSSVDGCIDIDIRRRADINGSGGQKGEPVFSELTADAEDLPLANSCKDYIIASHVLEHLINPIKCLKEWRRVLNPGGRLFITMPDNDTIDSMIIDYTHLHAYNKESLFDILSITGFEVSLIEQDAHGALRAVAVNKELVSI